MIFSKIMKGIKEAFMVSGYSRTAKELQMLSETQLNDIGVSREHLKKGGSAYPWREAEIIVPQVIPSNIAQFRTAKEIEHTTIMPRRPRAA